ncbi:hypothetical protein AADZ86_04860 [Colwelliaceae bacterium BS250]
MFLQFKMIRNNLIAKGKLVTYGFYALGELLLVVAGILIALQLNNYDLERQFKETEIQYYQSMKLQLLDDKKLLEVEISDINVRVEDYLVAIKLIKANDHQHNNLLGAKINQLLQYGDFRRKSSVFQTLIYSGEIKNIKNLSIVANLQEIERTYEITERLETIQEQLVMALNGPAVIEVIDIETSSIISSELIYTPTFKNRFFVTIGIAIEKKQEFEHALSVINDTLIAIDVELKNSPQ